MNNVSAERLMGDLKNVARDAEDLLKASAGEVSEKTHEIRARLAASIGRAKDACERLEENAAAGVKATDKIIRDHPYQSIGIAFGVGLIIGVLTRK